MEKARGSRDVSQKPQRLLRLRRVLRLTCFGVSIAQYNNGPANVLPVCGGTTQFAFGITAGGGPQELLCSPTQIAWIISLKLAELGDSFFHNHRESAGLHGGISGRDERRFDLFSRETA